MERTTEARRVPNNAIKEQGGRLTLAAQEIFDEGPDKRPSDGYGCCYVAYRGDRPNEWKIGQSEQYPPERRMKELKCTTKDSFDTKYRMLLEKVVQQEFIDYKLPGKIPKEDGGQEWYGKGLHFSLLKGRINLVRRMIRENYA